MIFDLPPPAIIQRAEPWERELSSKLAQLGLPRHVRRAIVAEFRRLEGSPPRIHRPAFDDLARYGKDPALSSLLCPPIGWNVAAFTVTFINTGTSTATTAAIDFGNFNAPTAGLMVVVCGCPSGSSNESLTVSSISIGGSNGTKVFSLSSAQQLSEIAYRQVSSGNNNVTVTRSSTTSSGSSTVVDVYLIINNQSDTPTANADSGVASATSRTATFTVPALGYAFYALTKGNTAAVTWTAATARGSQTNSSRSAFLSYYDRSSQGSDDTSHGEQASWTGSTNSRLIGAAWH